MTKTWCSLSVRAPEAGRLILGHEVAGNVVETGPGMTKDQQKEQERGVRSKSGKTLASNRFVDVDF
jgi:D-arabinose 1-dehydrogenase-like Zn-dependent alcohol dehydrogenase